MGASLGRSHECTLKVRLPKLKLAYCAGLSHTADMRLHTYVGTLLAK